MSHDTNAVTIRPATREDASAMIVLDRSCSTAAHWTELQYQQISGPGGYGPGRLVVVAERCLSNATEDAGSHVVGFMVARHVASEWELENIVVDPALRRSGIGTRLLEVLLEEARRREGEAVFLEVRESNAAARILYEEAGFRETGRRRLYYSDPAEDAILYRWSRV